VLRTPDWIASGLRTVRYGYAVVWGERVTTHPLASPATWRSSLKAQAAAATEAWRLWPLARVP
jgi:hypothetical protein